MRHDDPNTYYQDGWAAFNSANVFGKGIGMVHLGGKEIWCNRVGKYIHIVADLSHMSGQNYEVSICSIGIMGTKYVRAETLQNSIEVVKGGSQTVLVVPNIYSSVPIGTTLEINLRMPEETLRPNVTLVEESGQTLVTIDP